MNIAYADHPLFLSSAQTPNWLQGSLEAVPGGHIVVLPSGRILSVQPDGSLQDRDRNAVGPWETCQIDPAINVLRFSGAGTPYAIVYKGA